MRALVTGAQGFIGSVLCARLSELGHDVLAVDNGSRGLNDVSRLPHVTFMNRDYQGVLHAVRADIVVHLAAKTGSLSYPLDELMQYNAADALDFFQDAQRRGVRVFVFPTTSLALGVPESPYVLSKEAGLQTLISQALEWPKLTCLLPCRFFNVSGGYRGFTEKRQHEVHILPTLWRCYVDREPFTINGDDYATHDGTPSRDYIHVLDVVDYLIYRMVRILAGDAYDQAEIINLGRGRPVTVQQVLKVCAESGYSIESIIGPRRAFDCGELRCPQEAVDRLQQWRPLRSVYDMVRDEFRALSGVQEAMYID